MFCRAYKTLTAVPPWQFKLYKDCRANTAGTGTTSLLPSYLLGLHLLDLTLSWLFIV